MDPNLMKFLEEDEDETMHSGADVEAFTAELNRDIEGNASTAQQPTDSDSALSRGNSQTTSHFLPQYGIANFQSSQDHRSMDEKEHHSSQSGPQQQHQQQQQQQQQMHILDPENRKDEALLHNSSTDDVSFFPVSNPMATQSSREQSIHIKEQDSKSIAERESQIGKLQNVSSRPMMSMVPANDQRPRPMEPKDQQSMLASGLNSQQPMSGGGQQQESTLKSNKQVPFGMLLPIIQPQLDKDRAMQLHTLYFKLKKNEISKDEFIRQMRNIVGDQMLKMAVYKLQTQDARNPKTTSSQFQSQPQASAGKMQASSNSSSTSDCNTREDIQADFQASDRKHPMFPTQGLNKQQHMHLPQTSFPTYGGTTGSGYSNFPASQMRQAPVHQNMTANHAGSTPGPANTLHVPNFDRSHPLGSDQKKIQTGGLTDIQKIGSMAHVKQEPVDQSIEQRQNTSHGLSSLSRAPTKQGTGNVSGSLKDESFEMQPSRMGFIPSAGVGPTNPISSSIPSPMETNILSNPRSITASLRSGNIFKAPLKKPSVGQKKPMDAAPPGSSPPSSKKQKVSGASFLDQSIDQLNDVTAGSGVNLREEEEQLFSGPKEDSRVSEASRRVVQEEEDRLILNKSPLQKKLVEIMAKCGLQNMSNDVERCLSLCVEERMRGLISNAIRLSKQRIDFEKPRHKTIITSDIRQQIMAINRKAREELEKKQAETDKSQRTNDPESNSGVDGDMEKEEGRGKQTKANKEEDDKMRATAANVAVRAATGVGDMLSRWQLMIEAKQKTGGGSDTPSGSQPSKDLARRSSANTNKITRENQEAEKWDPLSAAFTTPASVRKVGRNQVVVPRVARSISTKDVIAILEREPQMSKSTLLYRLYNKVTADAAAA